MCIPAMQTFVQRKYMLSVSRATSTRDTVMNKDRQDLMKLKVGTTHPH